MVNPSWTVLTNHGALILLLIRQPNLTIRQIANELKLSDRTVVNILADLRRDGYLETVKQGRTSTHHIRLDRPMRREAHTHISLRHAVTTLARWEDVQTPEPPPATEKMANPLYDRPLLERLVRGARTLTGARQVGITRYDADEGVVRLVAVDDGIPDALYDQIVSQARRFAPRFDPRSAVFSPEVNGLNHRVYVGGQEVEGLLREMAAGIVHPRVLALVAGVVRLRYALVIPLWLRGSVIGAMAYHTSRRFDDRLRELCRAITAYTMVRLSGGGYDPTGVIGVPVDT